jgi:hypothetical protein
MPFEELKVTQMITKAASNYEGGQNISLSKNNSATTVCSNHALYCT